MPELRGSRVLVTGASGFVGANLVGTLRQRGADVHALVRPGSVPARIAEIVPESGVHRVDLLDSLGLRRAIDALRPEIVFHLARYGGLRGQDDERQTVMTNVVGTATLLEATKPLQYRRFVHFGSSLEYGSKNAPLEEGDRLEPVTLFAATKAASTLLCQQFARAHRRPITVLRPFSIYGYWEQPNRLIPTAIRAALAHQELPLTGPGYRHDFVFVEDVIEAALLAVAVELAPGEILNVGSGCQTSNEDVVRAISELTGHEIRVRPGAYPAHPTDTHHWVADVRKARRLLGWQARHGLREGLTKTIAWVRRRQKMGRA